MSTVDHAIEVIAERSGRGSMNESITKVLLIEPLLAAAMTETGVVTPPGWRPRHLAGMPSETAVSNC